METIEDIVREMRAMKSGQHVDGGRLYERFMMKCQIAEEYADRVLAAHKREMMHNESLLQKAGATVVELMNTMSAQHEEIKKLRGLVVLLTSALERATVMRCIMADSGIPCKDLLDNNSCGAENCKSMCGRWRELIDKAKKEVTK